MVTETPTAYIGRSSCFSDKIINETRIKSLVSLSIDLADNLERQYSFSYAYPPTPIMAIDLPEFHTSEYTNGIRGQYLINMKALRQSLRLMKIIPMFAKVFRKMLFLM